MDSYVSTEDKYSSTSVDVDILSVLQDTFVLDGEVIFDDYVIRCPAPDHDDEDPSCYVLLKDKTTRKGKTVKAGAFHCFACGAKGDLLKLGSYVLKLRRKEVRELLVPNNPEASKAALLVRLRSLDRGTETLLSRLKRQDEWLERSWLEEGHREADSYEDGPLTYLYKRNFKPKTLKKWGVRYVSRTEVATKKGRATLRNTVAIPICDRSGLVVSWCYRATDQSDYWQPRYLYTLNSPRSEVFIGEQVQRSENVVIAEGSLDAMWIDQCGVPAIGLGGTGINSERVERLASYKSAILFMDRDKPGQIATYQIGSVLSEIIPTLVVRYPRSSAATDPQEMDEEDVRKAIDRAIPFAAWQLRLAGNRTME